MQIGGGSQAVGIPQSLHNGNGGVHNIEKNIGIWGTDSKNAGLLQQFVNKKC